MLTRLVKGKKENYSFCEICGNGFILINEAQNCCNSAKFIKCPKCNREQKLKWIINKDSDKVYQCELCDHQIKLK